MAELAIAARRGAKNDKLILGSSSSAGSREIMKPRRVEWKEEVLSAFTRGSMR